MTSLQGSHSLISPGHGGLTHWSPQGEGGSYLATAPSRTHCPVPCYQGSCPDPRGGLTVSGFLSPGAMQGLDVQPGLQYSRHLPSPIPLPLTALGDQPIDGQRQILPLSLAEVCAAPPSVQPLPLPLPEGAIVGTPSPSWPGTSGKTRLHPKSRTQLLWWRREAPPDPATLEENSCHLRGAHGATIPQHRG